LLGLSCSSVSALIQKKIKMHGVKNNVVGLTVPWCRVNESNGGKGGVPNCGL